MPLLSLAIFVACLIAANAHTVFLCINSGQNEITAYGGTYHTMSQVGGMIIAGGQPGNEQYDPICAVPYGSFPSGQYPGEVTSGITSGGNQAWSCGQRFDWDTTIAPLTYAQVSAEAPTANCAPIGTAANSYDITSSSITWNKVKIPVSTCGEGVDYALISTSDSADDSPWMNLWAITECVPGVGFNTPSPSTLAPTPSPSTLAPTPSPSTLATTPSPTEMPTEFPSTGPSFKPSISPSAFPSVAPSASPSAAPSASPSAVPSESPSEHPSDIPSDIPSSSPTESPQPSGLPSSSPSVSQKPSAAPSQGPSALPSTSPSSMPSSSPTCADSDADGICDVNDNCPNFFNPSQADGDADGEGDACEPISSPASFLVVVGGSVLLGDGNSVCSGVGVSSVLFDYVGTTLTNGEFTNTSSPGVFEYCATCNNGDGTDTACNYVVVHDPFAGDKVTGGGWFNSPKGALVGSEAEGRVNFGFNVKYNKGGNVQPTGSTNVVFSAGDFHFHSTSYEWLVVVPGMDKAKFEGEGTVNGNGSFGFMVTVVDNGSTNGDLFRIKIWDKDGGDAVVYDNKLGSDDDGYDGTTIAGGNIVIHIPKGGKKRRLGQN